MKTRTLPALALITVALSMLGCSYSSFYRETNHDVHPKAIAAKDVRVFRQKEDVKSEIVELGLYRGQAPTVAEAMEAAKRQCASKGAALYILNTAPFKSGNVYKVDGVCAVEADATSAPASNGKKVR